MAATLLPADFFTKTHFMRVVDRLERTSSPGIPICYSYATNAQFLLASDGSYNQENLDLLWRMVSNWVEGQEPSPLRVFIKKEPHKLEKIREGRLRLIMAVGLAEQVVDHMLFGEQNQRNIDLFVSTPCAPGWGITYGGWRAVDTKAIGYDRRAWDYSVPRWLLELELDLRANLLVNSSELWLNMARRRYSELFDSPVLQLSSGFRFRQEVRGIVKSGTVNTIATNTHCQLLLHAYCSFKSGLDDSGYFLAMGDDTLQDHVSDAYVRTMKEIVRLKEPVVGEFCSMQFYPGGVVEPLNYGKHLCNLLYQKDEHLGDSLRSLQILYALSGKRERIRQLAFAIEPASIMFDAELERLMG